jgi:hypothetical protein
VIGRNRGVGDASVVTKRTKKARDRKKRSKGGKEPE